MMAEIYRPLFLNASPLLFASRRAAELIKDAANAFLAMKITFINEIADLCEKVGADVQDVARGIGADNRIGPKFLHAGPGFGGSCFPKDTLALVKTAQDYDTPLRLIEATVAVNDQRKRAMARRIIVAAGGSVRGKVIAVLGLTFKPNTDDIREAPALAIIRGLLDAGAIIRAHDPEGMEQARVVLPEVEFCRSPYEEARGASALAIVTEWDQFRALGLRRLKEAMAQAVLIDLRNIYSAREVVRHGFRYVGIGQGDDEQPPAVRLRRTRRPEMTGPAVLDGAAPAHAHDRRRA